MHSFVDNANRTWELTINVSIVKRVRALVDVDLYGLVDEGFKSLSALIADPVQLAERFVLSLQRASRESSQCNR